jgi:penicillin amidase
MQNDVVSLPARQLLPVVAAHKAVDADAASAQRLLGGWNGTLDGSSGAAALYEVWMLHHLPEAIKNMLVSPRAAATFDGADIDVIVETLAKPWQWMHRNGRARRDAVLDKTLAAAWRETVERLGPDAGAWHWSSLHANLTEHPFSAILDTAERAQWNIGPLPKGGDGYVPNMSWVRESDFRQVTGPSIRVVMDVGHWDESWAVNFPGQSGDVRDAHYRDLAGPWLRGEYIPLLFTRAAVERVTERTIRLIPP